ncbi:MAG: hypothetical protein KA100_05695 [Rickettsiales bacterium]|nr:hypothetical protein [Rickettsiales bacterium]
MLELQKNIEEKRLILGKKFENFLLKKLGIFGVFVSKIFAAKSCALFGFLTIFALSIFLRSTRDIGPDSGAYLEIAAKILAGGKYYQDFFTNIFPLAFCFTLIPVFLAKIFAISPILLSEIFVNLVGILAIYFSAKILSRSDVSKDRTSFNLIILSFSAAFFLRFFTLQFNEFATKSTYFLAFAFPYISYQFLKNSELKKSDQIFIGTLAALLIGLDPHYAILVIVFEVEKIRQKKSAFCPRNFTTILLLICYAAFVFKAFPSFDVIQKFYPEENLFLLLRQDIFAVFLLIFLGFAVLKKNHFLQPLLLASLASALLVISQMTAEFDQRFVFYSLSLPLIILLVIDLHKSHYINWRRDFVVLTLILTAPQFDPQIFNKVILNLGAFWWLMVLFLSAQWRKNFNEPYPSHCERSAAIQFLLPHDTFSWLYFLALTALTISLSINKNLNNLSWVLSATILILVINFYQNLHQKNCGKKEFSTLTASAIFLVISYLISLQIAAMLATPNQLNQQMAQVIKNIGEGEVTIISNETSTTYPLINYAKKTNNLPSLQLNSLYQFDQKNEANAYLFLRLKQQIERRENKLIIIKKASNGKVSCQIGFLEYYFFDQNFKKVFLQNYVFLKPLISLEKLEKEVRFFDEEKTLELPQSTEFITQEFEIYVRKNDR